MGIGFLAGFAFRFEGVQDAGVAGGDPVEDRRKVGVEHTATGGELIKAVAGIFVAFDQHGAIGGDGDVPAKEVEDRLPARWGRTLQVCA